MLIESKKNDTNQYDQFYFGRGKLLLSGEYFILDGAKSIALPVKYGQTLNVEYTNSYSPHLHWKSYDVNGRKWFDAKFEFWKFKAIDDNNSKEALILQKILQEARKQNPHFLRDDVNVHVTTKLGFPLEWGLGSSSTLIYNIAQWAYISPFELLFNTLGGSGYDVACAQSTRPIIYEKQSSGPSWQQINFDPIFKDNLYFVYLGHKKDSSEAVKYYKENRPYPPEIITALSLLTDDMIKCKTFEEFNFLINAHEGLVSKYLKLQTSKDLYFSDFWGEVKSLGAWGGDFVLVSSDQTEVETRKYFEEKHFYTVIPYRDLIYSDNLGNDEKVNKKMEKNHEYIQ